mmetsp:Transcript_5509/g.10541  ORF Transcript_5509/g.10541 Transcript_5509/m.10541 type:complete len:273 (-) Transcript_5509:131-949(-)
MGCSSKDIRLKAPQRLSEENGCVRLWIVRHAERIDEMSSIWVPETDEFLYDCPITSSGHVQAQARGSWFVQELKKLNADDVDIVYSSPFLRAIQTAQCIASQLNARVQPIVGLGYCMATITANRKGRTLELLSQEKLSEKCKGIELSETDCTAEHFAQTLDRLVRSAFTEKRKQLVVVTHREVFYELDRALNGAHRRDLQQQVPYCGTVLYECFRPSSDAKMLEWKLVRRYYQKFVSSDASGGRRSSDRSSSGKNAAQPRDAEDGNLGCKSK